MPVSDRYQAIFLHNPKTGGTTIENLLEIPSGFESLRLECYHDTQLPALHHSPYYQLQMLIPEKMSCYFKFTYVRNPWDRLVSTYAWRSRGFETFEKFIDYVDRLFTSTTPEQFHLLPDFSEKFTAHLYPQHFYDGEGVTVYRFENFREETQSLLDRLGIQKEITIDNPSTHEHYFRYYNDRTRAIVASHYAEDIRRYNYTFEENLPS